MCAPIGLPRGWAFALTKPIGGTGCPSALPGAGWVAPLSFRSGGPAYGPSLFGSIRLLKPELHCPPPTAAAPLPFSWWEGGFRVLVVAAAGTFNAKVCAFFPDIKSWWCFALPMTFARKGGGI